MGRQLVLNERARPQNVALDLAEQLLQRAVDSEVTLSLKALMRMCLPKQLQPARAIDQDDIGHLAYRLPAAAGRRKAMSCGWSTPALAAMLAAIASPAAGARRRRIDRPRRRSLPPAAGVGQSPHPPRFWQPLTLQFGYTRLNFRIR